ncbi:hypothetical protein [Streptoalloteichus hindustanus]|uniref:N-Dimethylarginine dimethylaminohydrolase n=1 Tax=Streptoalloteichus hindustanus TaxID=2017 RepID=A0A1M5NKL8_STRHI|nr:hypothetical protein [Streptoalloteichus hindustanus]SHG90048.1 N-Dimethylarginine dimethylaminohydrolase [Streptoalloteichus hindustanus]
MTAQLNAGPAEGEADWLNPTQLPHPAFLLTVPFALVAEAGREGPPRGPSVERHRAMSQFLELYRDLTADALVYLLPTPRVTGLRDLARTASLGVVLEHLPAANVVVLAHFADPARRAGTEIALAFFESLGYRAFVPAGHFEGEADLKHLRDDVYVGGCGPRSEPQVYDWMERTFDMRVVRLRTAESPTAAPPHLDQTVFPLTRDRTLVCVEAHDRGEIRRLERHTEVIPVPLSACRAGVCNSVRVNNTVLNASHLHELRPGSEAHAAELAKNRLLEDLAARLAFEVNHVNLSEFRKTGALLSSLVMHLNRYSYRFELM